MIGVTTIKSSNYIYASLERIYAEIMLLPDEFNASLAVCVNGDDENLETRSEVSKFFAAHANVDGHIISGEKAGKNNAMNKIIELARKMDDIEIVHFFDDDVYLSEKSLLVNLGELMRHEQEVGLPVLVGSAFIAIKYPLGFFWQRYPSLEAIRKWIFHSIIVQPYLLEAERPKFCEGPSFGTYLKYLPTLPDDEIGITDDAFLSNYYVVNGKNEYLNNGTPAIIKPPNSISYIKVPLSFQEWKKQQIRIHAGIERAFNYFGSERIFLQQYFSWKYAFNKESRTNTKINSLLKRMLFCIYMFLHEKNRKAAERFLKENSVPNWSIAETTKI